MTGEVRSEEVWDVLSQDPGPSDAVRGAWTLALGGNRAAPDDVLCRLLDISPYFLLSRLTPAVVDAAIAHPDRKIRVLLAESQQVMTAEQQDRLLFDGPNAQHRHAATMLAADKRVELAEATYERLVSDPSAGVRAEATRFPRLPARLLTVLATEADRSVRAAVAMNAWPRLDRPVRDALLADQDPRVRAAALIRHHEDHPMSRPVFDLVGHCDSMADRATENCRLDRRLAEELCAQGDPARRRILARNPHLDPELVAVLAADLDHDVRFEVSLRPELTEEQRAAVRVDIDLGIHRHDLPWVVASHDDPAAMRRCAASSHVLLRRSAARARRLPPDVVELLARDDDRVVRLFLAESCDDAPADLLLEVWRWWSGSFSVPDRPRGHPNFPTRDLLRYADDPHPRMRQLALDDPESTVELVEWFSRDIDEEVRRRAASDPRLSADSAVRLLDDPSDSVCGAAAGHPRLPAAVLVRLLLNSRTAMAAAGNPALPVGVMHQMIDVAQRV